MNTLKNQAKEKEEKYNRFKKDIHNERMFLFKINNLFSDEFEEMIEDILILDENQFMSQLKDRYDMGYYTGQDAWCTLYEPPEYCPLLNRDGQMCLFWEGKNIDGINN